MHTKLLAVAAVVCSMHLENGHNHIKNSPLLTYIPVSVEENQIEMN